MFRVKNIPTFAINKALERLFDQLCGLGFDVFAEVFEQPPDALKIVCHTIDVVPLASNALDYDCVNAYYPSLAF